jgi:hypothetical protein
MKMEIAKEKTKKIKNRGKKEKFLPNSPIKH